MGQQGPGGFAEPGGFAGPAGGAPGNAQGWNGAPDWRATPGWNSVPDWQRPPVPDGGAGPNTYPGRGYPGPNGQGENVNGGDYAYVINEDGVGPSRPGRPDGARRPTGESPPAADQRGEASTDSLRAITSGATRLTRDAGPPVDASEAYGPDDPAYGPPGPDWYDKEQTAPAHEGAAAKSVAEPARAPEPAETTRRAAASEPAQSAQVAQAAATHLIDPDPPAVRGPFEPLVEARRQTSDRDGVGPDRGAGASAARSWDDLADADAWGGAADDLDAAPTGTPEYESASYEFPGIADDDPAGSADAALDRLKALHLTAAAVAPQSLDAHFDQLLERQRKLISEYLGQNGGPGTPASAASASTATAVNLAEDGSLVGFGDDQLSAR